MKDFYGIRLFAHAMCTSKPADDKANIPCLITENEQEWLNGLHGKRLQNRGINPSANEQ